MKSDNTISILAAFATLKSLNDEKRYSSPYQLLSEFINYIICEKNMYSFTADEMKNQLKEVFGFKIPEAVVKTAAKTLKFISKGDNIFTVNTQEMGDNNKFEDVMTSAEQDYNKILKRLSSYIAQKNPEQEINEAEVNTDLIAFLIDDQYKSSGNYVNIISEFILKNEGDKEIQTALNAIREGSILYIGINHNINETGSLKKEITLFLDVEVLFSFAGFNGEIYKTLALDLYNQVRIANTSGKKVVLKYFTDTRKEIDTFFGTAESIVEGKIKLSNKPAMRVIVNGCKTAADVQVKQSDFFHELQFRYGITEDSFDYYAEELNEYNLESKEYGDKQEQEGWKVVSHINKRRKGNVCSDNLESEYLFITNTYNILKASKNQSVKIKESGLMDYVCDFAVSVNRMTNILWYKLGNGFGGKERPTNVSSILKARLILASNIATNVEKIYKETTEQYNNGSITSEQLAARIITLRGKPVFPEELEGDSIDENMDFSAEYLSRYEEKVRLNEVELEEKEKLIKEMKEHQKNEISAKEKTIAEKEIQLQKREQEKKQLEEELDGYRQKELKKQKRKNLIKNILLFLWSFLWKSSIVVALIFSGIWIDNNTEMDILKYVILAVDIIGVITVFISVLGKDIRKYFLENK